MHNYLKYWKVVKQFVKVKYKVSTSDLEMLLFLRSEKYFGKSDFDEFNELFHWDKNRFERLKKEGWIDVFRKKNGKQRVLYQLSYKAQRMISSLYKKLEGEEIPESRTSNPMFLSDVSYTDKVHRNFIKKLNESIRQQQRLSQ